MTRWRRVAPLVAGVLVVAVLSVAPASGFPVEDASLGATEFCGPDDRPETGYQGETTLQEALTGASQDPYFCGLRIVGHTDIWNRGGNWQLARSQHCAYVSTVKTVPLDPEDPVTTREPAGVAVIDVSDPTKPESVRVLRDPGSLDSIETMHAVDAGKRHVLAAGDYTGGTQWYPWSPVTNPETTSAALDIYDSTECAEPKHMATYYWPTNVHDVTISPDGKRIYGTGEGAVLYVLDITNMARPKLIADQPLILPGDSPSSVGWAPYPCHTVTFNRDETRMYCAGVVSSRSPDDGEQAEGSTWDKAGPTIWDVSEISRGRKNPEVRFVGEADIRGQGGHHAVPAIIDGKPHLIAANELGGCPNAVGRPPLGAYPTAYARIWDISAERAPRKVSEFHLEVTKHCDEERVQDSNTLGSWGLHYNNVDDPWGDTKLGLFGSTAAGLRIVDLRNPKHPREVAYYKPGGNPTAQLQPAGVHFGAALFANMNFLDACGSRNWFVKETGHIWFVCQANGFFVAELSPEVREYLGERADRRDAR
jgi:hypothetical protein